MEKQAIILYAHGSRDPRWQSPFLKITESLRAQLGQEKVYLSFMECAAPDLEEVCRQCVESGVTELKLLPLFMAGGGHVDKDIPAKVKEASSRFPEANIEILPPIGEHPEMVEMMLKIAGSYVG